MVQEKKVAADMELELRWHGRGGQGVVTASNLLVEAALAEGKYFQALPEFGAERSGAPILAYTRLSSRPISKRGQVAEPDIVVVFDPTLIGHVDVARGLKEGGVLVVNSPQAPEEVAKQLGVSGVRVFTVDASGIAKETMGRNIPNTPILGALVRATGVVSRESVRKVMEERLGQRFGPKVVQANLQAFDRAYEAVRGLQAGGEVAGGVRAEAADGLPTWRELTTGGIITTPGNSAEVDTGSWRSKRPVVDLARCSHCLICWVFCPDDCIQVEKGKLVSIDYDHCKGCGICALECPRKCIDMVDEVAAPV